MRVAVVGLGRTGREVLAALEARGHVAVPVRRGDAFPRDCTAGIDFSRADAVPTNVAAALGTATPYVVGTTGWESALPELTQQVERAGGALLHAANFSLGVNVFYRLVRDAARHLAALPEYDPFVLERHHRHKRDAPSGTARVLTTLLAEAYGPRRQPVTALEPGSALPDSAFHVASLRAGGIVGEHVVGWDSGDDEILLEHRARSRRGFALGAVRAAEWLPGRRGVFTLETLLDELLATPRS